MDMSTLGCHAVAMAPHDELEAHRHTIERIHQVRAAAVEHTAIARRLHAERRSLIEELLAAGISQAAVARELGISRQAIQQMLA